MCNGPTHGNCVCGECLCNGNENEESGIWFEGDFCQIASETNNQLGAVATCDKLTPCVKSDLFPDDEDADKWRKECSAFSVREFYECHNVNERVNISTLTINILTFVLTVQYYQCMLSIPISLEQHSPGLPANPWGLPC